MQRWLRIVLVVAAAVDRRADPIVSPMVRLLGSLTGWGSRRLSFGLWLASIGATGGWLAARGSEHGLTGGLLFDAGLQGILAWATLQLMGLSLALPGDRPSLPGAMLRLVGALALVSGLVGLLAGLDLPAFLYLARGVLVAGAAWAATTKLPEGRIRIGRLVPATVPVHSRR